MEVIEEEKCTLEQQVKVMVAELAIEKASSNQAGKDKNLLESYLLSNFPRLLRRLGA